MSRLILVLGLMGSLASAAQAEGVGNLPETIAVKAGAPVAQLQAAGAQIYICAKNAAGALTWTFREPLATLLEEGKTVGRHFVGPTWEFVDGSRVVGELVSKAPGTTAKDIPWLKLSVKDPRNPVWSRGQRRSYGSTRRGASSRELAIAKANCIRSRMPRPTYS